ncbi:hypothetical protein ACHHYP_01088 [Achlya hypogyna]|uniref:PB1 domain-containing protein n=1 Tax=Achlya hypogyna TaxID=1202772 RepID=A0A1V9Z9I6_ACHHY|nr:hypothetical protein ACHHYP_01088 [Achlya hypogyna]
MATSVALKIGFKGEIHRIRVNLEAFGVADLHALFGATFSLAPGAFVVQYKAADASFVNVVSADDFALAVSQQRAAGDAKCLRFFAVSRTEATFHENVIVGIRKALGSFSTALDKVKAEPWVQDLKLPDTFTASLGQAYAKTIAESKATLANAKTSLAEIEVDKILASTKHNLRQAASGVSTYAHDIVESLQPKPTEAPATAEPKWQYQLATVRDFLPDVADDVAIAALERANGDVHVALNEIMSS